MKFAWQILTHTPIWVFPLLAYLVWLGIKAMRPRTVTIWRSLIVPAVFIVWGLSRLLSRQDIVWPLAAWLGAAAVLLVVGLLTARPIELDHTTGEIKRPGSVIPLIRNITVFALQYTVAVIAAVDPHDAHHGRDHRSRRYRRNDRLFPRAHGRAAAQYFSSVERTLRLDRARSARHRAAVEALQFGWPLRAAGAASGAGGAGRRR